MTDWDTRFAAARVARHLPRGGCRAGTIGDGLGRPAQLAATAAAALALAAMVIVLVPGLRARLLATRASLRRSSSPGAGCYDLFAGRLLGGLYDVVSRDAAAAVRAIDEPAVLEIGPGPGDLAVRLARLVPTLRLTGLDVDAGMVALAARKAAEAGVAGRARFVEGDVAAIPFPDATFDLVVSTLSVHHWPDAAVGFAEVRRVLRPGGRAIICDLPDRWGRLETGAPGLAESARRGGFEAAAVDTVRWPGPVRLVRRAVLERG
jgi:SAM-dependent methyltransferase